VGILEPEARAAPPLDEPLRLGEPLRQPPAQLRCGLPGALAFADRGEQVRQVTPVLQGYRIDARSELACVRIAQPVRPPRRRGRARCESPRRPAPTGRRPAYRRTARPSRGRPRDRYPGRARTRPP